jgi:UDP-N-acetylmuramoyl-tripeptide--D-alanyl-D-alanine ligase
MKFRERKYHPRQFWRWLRSRIHRFRYLSRSDVFALTGSCGKTSATHFLGKIMSDSGSCYVGIHRNSADAIRKNLRKIDRSYRFFVQETGVASPGDMKQNVIELHPNIGIVTTIGQDHFTSFRTLEATAAEKGVLIESLPKNGTAVLNADDPLVLSMRQRTRAKVLTYGISEQADVQASDIRSTWPARLSLTVTYRGESVRIETGLFGDLVTTALLGAVGGALAAGMSLEQCAISLKGIESFPGRLSIHRSIGGAWILKDTVKAPYWSVEKVIGLMKDAVAPRKTIMLGSFSDTGAGNSRRYRAMARLALEVADRVIFVGKNARHIQKMITPQLERRLFALDCMETACSYLQDNSLENELVLLKSSSKSHLERILCGQKEGFKCWRGSCEKKIDCETCPESGLVANVPVQKDWIHG